MKKIILLFMFVVLPCTIFAQKSDDMSKYMAGAVPVNEAGFVYFDKTYNVPGKSKAELFEILRNYTQTEIVEGEDRLPQARITELTPEEGIIAASMEEYLWFKRSALVNHRVRFFYQLIFRISDGSFNVEMRNLHYLYDDIPNAQDYRAEKWITDEEALNKDKTKLRKTPGKFRRFTIDRKDEIFRGAARAAGALKKVKRTVVEEVEYEE